MYVTSTSDMKQMSNNLLTQTERWSEILWIDI